MPEVATGVLTPDETLVDLARRGERSAWEALFHRHRILTQVSGDHIEVIKLIPPLIIGERELDRFVAGFVDVMDDAHRGTALTRSFASRLAGQRRPP